MRLISARWVFPIATPAIPEGAVVLDDQSRPDHAVAAPSGDGVRAGGGGVVRPHDKKSVAGRPPPRPPATILAVGRRTDLRRAYPGATEWRARGALCPALVNAHAHLELSALSTPVPGGAGVVDWTRRLMAATSGQDPARVRQAAVEAACAARSFGTVAVGDVGNGTAGWLALDAADVQGLFFHELVGSRETRTGDALGDAAQERARAQVETGAGPPTVPAVPAPHAPYSVGPDLMRRIFAAAATAGYPTTIHLAEDADEVLLLREGTGAWPAILNAMGVPPGERTPRLGPAAYLASLGAFAPGHLPPLLVHMVHADADDRRRARQAGATVVLCPRSNLHIGGRLPDVQAMVDERLPLAIGTDSLASVPTLSLWDELATLATHFPDIAPGTWLRAATMGGAAALGLSDLGALAPGMRPGLLDVGHFPAQPDGGGGEWSGRAPASAQAAERRLFADHPLSVSWIDPPNIPHPGFTEEVSP